MNVMEVKTGKMGAIC